MSAMPIRLCWSAGVVAVVVPSPNRILLTLAATVMPLGSPLVLAVVRYLAGLADVSNTLMPPSVRSVTYRRRVAWLTSMMSTDRVLPVAGGMGTLVSVSWVVSAATTGNVVATGFAAALPAAEGLAEAAALAATDAAGLEAATDAAGALEGAAVPPHAASTSPKPREILAKPGNEHIGVLLD